MPNRILKAWLRLVTSHPGKVILLCLATTAFFAWHSANNKRLDNALDKLMSAGDPDWDYTKKARRTFNNWNSILVTLSAPDCFDPGVLAQEAELSRRFSRLELEIDGVRVNPVIDIVGLSDCNTVVSSETGMRVIPVMDEPPPDRGGAELVRERALNDPILVDNCANRSCTMIALQVMLAPPPKGMMPFGQEVAKRLEEIADDVQSKGPAEIRTIGEPVFNLTATEHTRRDLTMLAPLGLLLVAGVLALAFRSLAGVLLPLLTPVCAVIWTLGFVALTGSSLTVTTGIVPLLVVSIGTASTMHVVAHHGLEGGENPREYVRAALAKVGGAVLLAGCTTALGFSSLITSNIINIREMGLYASFGIVADTILSLSLVPALLTFRRRPVSRPGRTSGTPLVNRLLVAAGRLSRKYRWQVLGISGMIVIACVAGMAGLRVETNYLQLLREDDPFRVTDTLIQEKLAGLRSFDLYVEPDAGYFASRTGNQDKLFREPELLKRMVKLHRLFEPLRCPCGSELPLEGKPPGSNVSCPRCNATHVIPRKSPLARTVRNVISVADFVRQMHRASNGGDPAAYAIPEERATISKYFFNHGHPEDMDPYIVPNHMFARVIVQTDMEPTSANVTAFNEELGSRAREIFGPTASVRACNAGTCIASAQDAISWGQLKSLGITLLCISLILALVFRSLRIGLIALLPNLLPLAVLFGMMGWAGIRLDIGTSIVGCMGLGIAVDDTIHFLDRYFREVAAGHPSPTAVERTLSTTGRPILFTSVALTLGYGLLTMSSFVPIAHLGMCTAVTMMSAMVGDLLLLPALLAVFEPAPGSRPTSTAKEHREVKPRQSAI